MATTRTQTNYWMLTLESSTTPVFNFKFVVDVYVGSPGGVKVVRIKQPKNPAGKAHISFEKIIKDYIDITYETDVNTATYDIEDRHIHDLPIFEEGEKPFSTNNGKTFRTVVFKFYEEYATTATGPVSVTPTTTATDVVWYRINYADSWEDQMNFNTQPFCFNTSRPRDGKFLTDWPLSDTQSGYYLTHPYRTSYNENRTLSFINSDKVTSSDTNLDSSLGKITISFFEEKPVLSTVPGFSTFKFPRNYVGKIIIDNDSTFGGANPNSTTDAQQLLYFGAGANNMTHIDIPDRGGYNLNPTSGIKYYTINYSSLTGSMPESFSNSSPSPIKKGDYIRINSANTINFVLLGAPDNNTNTFFYADEDGEGITGTGTYQIYHYKSLSHFYQFEIVDCSLYDQYCLAWKNIYGTWDYYMFEGKSTENISYDRKETYKRLPGNYGGSTFDLASYERGKIEKTTGSKSVTVNTDFVDESYNKYFEGLLMSNDVQLTYPSSQPVPVNITDKSFTYKTHNNDKLIQYKFTFEFAHKEKTFV